MLALRRVSKFLINTINLQALHKPFSQSGGHCWVALLPELAGKANQYLLNHSDVCHRSPLVVYEDGVPLGPAHSPRSSICDEGTGRFNHWYDQLLFSTPDNSNPNSNGRRYTYSLSPWLFERRAGNRAHSIGGQRGDHLHGGPPERNWADVSSTLALSLQIVKAIRQTIPVPMGKTILELGPGSNCGVAMVLACFGMRPTVTDRFLIPWNSTYHRWYYTALAEELGRLDPTADPTPLRALVEADGYKRGILERVNWPDGELPLSSDSIDIVFSKGVIEYVEDHDTVFQQLNRVTRPGGVHFHLVHCHDHRDLQRPLEYLLLEEAEFREVFDHCQGACGNRLRPKEIMARFESAGFEVLGFDADMLTKLKYVDDLLPRLRSAQRSRYRDQPVDELRIIQGSCRLRKPK
jgi:SAM-dependent methyltransferase